LFGTLRRAGATCSLETGGTKFASSNGTIKKELRRLQSVLTNNKLFSQTIK
jgi:hypothetical protein